MPGEKAPASSSARKLSPTEGGFLRVSRPNPIFERVRDEIQYTFGGPFPQSFCPLCGRRNASFEATFRCRLCWEMFLCRGHQVGKEFICPVCAGSREEVEAARRLRQLEVEPPAGTYTEFGGEAVILGEPLSAEEEAEEEMVLVPAGEFLMGDDRRPVYVEAFYIDRYPVTNLQFRRFDPSHLFSPERAAYPATRWVSWYRARAYARWRGKRLPTEAEWEKAARGTDGRLFPWGNEFDPQCCNTKEGGVLGYTPVDRYPRGQSPYGCRDMAGNVMEWTADWFDETRSHRVVKGGSWDDFDYVTRCSNRQAYEHFYRMTMIIGFRCVRSL
ncbi:MAG: SUMF1/EgtB/PvdO family nonheme iron enzyme [Candidatus Tectomicrobia bacterium]|uniref:SUMF1/EgtB/PvdO family nonheme iron enzyme n=1 Tax=Tectimicrobiota bacterium TaxID=2528274 RepID=A0A932FXK1_UNCTE|nr:SUMF1/EgtB/PvdO family nonheme iron enzyme [Candidatus Tectomicrobia bacterium]